MYVTQHPPWGNSIFLKGLNRDLYWMDGCLWNASKVSVFFLTGIQLAVIHSCEYSGCFNRSLSEIAKLLKFLCHTLTFSGQ